MLGRPLRAAPLGRYRPVVRRMGVSAPPSGGGNTTNAASASQADVGTAIASASVGDTVQIPAGTATWTSFSIAKSVNIKGAGKTSTVITFGTGNSITKQSAGVTRFQDMGFTKSSGGTASKGCSLSGSWLSAEPIIFEDCRFDVSNSGLFEAYTLGIIFAKCHWYINDSGSENSILKVNYDELSGGSTAGYSVSWKTNDSMGTNDTVGKRNVYIEDCYVRYGSAQAFDFDNGSRVVVRGCRFDLGALNSHGLDTSGIGERHWEIYDNQFRFASAKSELGVADSSEYANLNWLIWIRGGTGVIYNNAIEDISSGYWGDKPEGKFDIRSAQDGSGAGYGDYGDGRAWLSSGSGAYPRQHQIGVNWNSGVGTNSGYFIDPVYIWGNTGTGTSGGGFLGFANGGAWGSQTGYFTSGTDYFNGGSAKSGYTAYTYPHPLRSTTGKAY